MKENTPSNEKMKINRIGLIIILTVTVSVASIRERISSSLSALKIFPSSLLTAIARNVVIAAELTPTSVSY